MNDLKYQQTSQLVKGSKLISFVAPLWHYNFTMNTITILPLQIELRQTKTKQDYWIIRTRLDDAPHAWLVFKEDEELNPKARSLLVNYREYLLKRKITLTIIKQQNKERVINIEL
ncbi:MAG: hypothetical protein MRERV_42c010 [Mycoplasmataceae bacterium RV_VA103A]|nr:MAG: hypothetical protein MRERV_42c010 [Mycoplasmataceae bacterium RV_VA103A]